MLDTFFIYAYSTKDEYVFYQLDDLEANNGQSVESLNLRARYFSKRLFKNASIGAIFPAQTEDKQITYSVNASIVSWWKCGEDKLKWRALDTAGATAKREIAEAKTNLLTERLQPIREIYREASRQERRALLASIIEIITS